MPVQWGRRRSVRGAVVVFAAVIALTGCSDGALTGSLSREATEITAAPATGPTVMRYGYSFAAPEGWSVPRDISVPEADVIVVNLASIAGSVENINVVLAPGVIKPSRFESRGVHELTEAGATDVVSRGRVMIAGSESAHLSAIYPTDGVEARVEQFYASTKEQTYIITFTSALTVSKADRDALAHSVLASWAWI